MNNLAESFNRWIKDVKTCMWLTLLVTCSWNCLTRYVPSPCTANNLCTSPGNYH
uniref:Uncharacterized protein n=1 Tax=Arundo donax TaxID=35708 RepID=A0A0A8Z9N6_ARUDO